MDLASTSSPETVKTHLDDRDDSDTFERTPEGLGFMDASKSVLELSWELFPPGHSSLSPSIAPRRRRGTVRSEAVKPIQVQVNLQQDLGLLKASKGDTGSVLWRSSYYLAHNILRQHHFAPSSSSLPLINAATLAKTRILELGSGTGLLAIVLQNLCGQFTASDRWENLKLIKRNLELNKVKARDLDEGGQRSPTSLKSTRKPSLARHTSHDRHKFQDDSNGGSQAKHDQILLEEIDWLAISQERKSDQKSSSQAQARPMPAYDLILCVDCIFNEHLAQPLVDTLVKYCPKGGQTIVWVIVELRSSDVLSKFLETWFNDPSGPWTIVRLSHASMGDWNGRRPRWVGWVGWR
ncbi:hypothetical protein BD324DRAFT_479323 [Kockovaella imperatae]|uniref:Methyltransferase-domain-containing protein n=1 Tax=Kockovaella imperatae TaxID=4999 RepID=A0A1Y1UG00_9TREE|nr:hypothetical protein BD324DRAFT_479323 [Kockovaella imperatae]ORX36948.1 hypothetical protein BD324DRAFT_479323 [Kockovaella imperatae]